MSATVIKNPVFVFFLVLLDTAVVRENFSILVLAVNLFLKYVAPEVVRATD